MVYDVLGNEVARLVNEEQSSGEYEVTFNASSLPSGVYFYELSLAGHRAIKKMILIR